MTWLIGAIKKEGYGDHRLKNVNKFTLKRREERMSLG